MSSLRRALVDALAGRNVSDEEGLMPEPKDYVMKELVEYLADRVLTQLMEFLNKESPGWHAEALSLERRELILLLNRRSASAPGICISGDGRVFLPAPRQGRWLTDEERARTRRP